MEESSEFLPYDPSQESIFPSELQVCGFTLLLKAFLNNVALLNMHVTLEHCIAFSLKPI